MKAIAFGSALAIAAIVTVSASGAASAAPSRALPRVAVAGDPGAIHLARNDHHDRGHHDRGLHKGWSKGKGHHRDQGRTLEMRGPVVVLPTPPRPPLPRLPSPPLDPRDLPRPPLPPVPRLPRP